MKKTRKNESGRSMVEMLGVLAVVGVLSVGGISAYTTAMEKNKANELLHRASMLATTISAQAMTNNGTLPSTVTSFGNTNYGTFSTTATEALDGKGFSIEISNMDSAVCTQMEKMGGGMVREATCDGTTATITYYKNLATNDEEGKNSPTGPDPACMDVKCDDGLKCFHGECKCSSGLFKCGTECCAEGAYCSQGADISTYTCAVPEDGDCKKNSDCKDAEGNVDTSKYCQLSASDCTGPTGGVCTDKGKLDDLKDTADFIVKTLNLPSGNLTVYKSSKEMNWWSASNLCQAHGKQMVSRADLGVSENSFCYFDYSKTINTRYYCICLEDEGCIQTANALYTMSGILWLADNTKGSSCKAHAMSIYDGILHELKRNNIYNYYALCR